MLQLNIFLKGSSLKNSTIIIDGLPADDNLYIVTNYGGFVKNHSFATDIPLVNVHLGIIENDKIINRHYVTALVGLPELSVVRIGSLWKQGKSADVHWNKEVNYKENLSLNLNLEEYEPKCIVYKYEGEKINSFSDLEEVNLATFAEISTNSTEKIYGSSFVKFNADNGKIYIVPSIELLMSTFVPRNKLIRNQLILNPLQNLIKNYIVNYSINDNQYNIEIEKVLEKETMIFLAYMCCDKKTKSILSKIWTSLESTNHSNIKHPYILPYHTKTISFRASGIWINKNLFFIQRIDNPKPPNDMKVKVKCYKTIGKNEDFKNNEIGELDDEKQFSTPINQNKINETTKITAKKNPSRTSGIKYIVSEVSPDNNDIDCDIDEEITIVDNNSFNSYSKNDVKIDGASSGKFSGQQGSQKIARTAYIVEENPIEINEIKEITDTLLSFIDTRTIQKLVFIDDHANEHNNLVYMSFNAHHIQLNDNKFWASGYKKGSGISKKKSGYRKLLLVKFDIEGKNPLYLLEIIRKADSDAFYGLIFQTVHELKFSDLETIKYVIASNKGHFKGENLRPFPFKAAKFKHTWGKMNERLNNICENIKQSDLFD